MHMVQAAINTENEICMWWRQKWLMFEFLEAQKCSWREDTIHRKEDRYISYHGCVVVWEQVTAGRLSYDGCAPQRILHLINHYMLHVTVYCYNDHVTLLYKNMKIAMSYIFYILDTITFEASCVWMEAKYREDWVMPREIEYFYASACVDIIYKTNKSKLARKNACREKEKFHWRTENGRQIRLPTSMKCKCGFCIPGTWQADMR